MKIEKIYTIIILFISFMFINVKAETQNYPLLNNNQIGYVNVYADEESNEKCSALGDFKGDLQSIFNAFKIVAPILTLVLSTYEFVSAITSKAAEGLQKSLKKFGTRLVLVVILYILPVLLNIILNLAYPGASTCIK